MRRHLVAVPLLVLTLAVAGCGGDEKDSHTNADSRTPSATASQTTTAPTITPTQPVTTSDFCRETQDAITAGSADTALQRVAIVVADGLPDDMPKDVVDGIQVLIDIAPQLQKSSSAFSAYKNLSSSQRGDINSLAGYLTVTCGKNLIADLVPALKKIPSDLLSLLPSGLPSVMSGN